MAVIFLFVPVFQDSLYLSNQLFLVRHIENIPGCEDIVGQAAQGIFRRDAVFFRTEDNTDRRVIVRVVDFCRRNPNMLLNWRMR